MFPFAAANAASTVTEPQRVLCSTGMVPSQHSHSTVTAPSQHRMLCIALSDAAR